MPQSMYSYPHKPGLPQNSQILGYDFIGVMISIYFHFIIQLVVTVDYRKHLNDLFMNMPVQ